MIRKIKKLIALVLASGLTLSSIYFGMNYLTVIGNEALEKREKEYMSELKSEKDKDAPVYMIKLKSGGELNGLIKEESDTGYVLDVGFGVVAIAKDDVMSLSTEGDERSQEQMKEEFKQQMIKTSSVSSKKKP
ncbi:MAG: hypothetical protein HQL29_00035 [Candidatus Omnitrophica bacterium]|nr:hypothetical protein [Candidatus Omnitrophota bacterium]